MKKIILFLCCCLNFSVYASVNPLPTYKFSKECPSDKPFQPSDGGECLGCDVLEGIVFYSENAKDFAICKNRKNSKEDGWQGFSILKKCPKTHSLRDDRGSCRSCDELKDIFVENQEDCNVCPNRELRTEEYEVYDGKKIIEYTHHCQLKQCPENAPLRGDGDCLPCDAHYWTDDPKEICDKCSNRQYIEKGEVVFVGIKDGNRWIKKTAHAGCYLKEYKGEYNEFRPLFSVSLEEEIITPPCEKGKLCPIYDLGWSTIVRCSDISQYDCEHMQHLDSCDEKDDIETLPEVCAKCPNRDYVEGKCIFRECPAGTIKKIDDNVYDLCVECDKKYSYIDDNGKLNISYLDIEITTKEECHKCPKRFWGMKYNNEYVCAPCDEDSDGYHDEYITSKEECDHCPNLVYNSDLELCVGKNSSAAVICQKGYRMNEDRECIRKWYNFFDWMRILK